jgi:hypothetical protein
MFTFFINLIIGAAIVLFLSILIDYFLIKLKKSPDNYVWGFWIFIFCLGCVKFSELLYHSLIYLFGLLI